MAYAFADTDTEAVQSPLRATLPLGLEADLCCLMCGRTVGEVVDGRAVQHLGCAGRLRRDRGLIRCCHCNGPVYREPLPILSLR